MDNAPIVMIPIERLYSHPDNPRKDLGDLTELTESIKANGVMQNLTVVPAHQVKAVWDWLTDPRNDIPGYAYSYVVLIGHRRMAAAKEAGLKELPCAVIEASDPKEQISIMLAENMQRSDLTPYEQARSFQMMIDMGGSVEEISKRSGFSVTTVRHRLKMAELDPETLRQVSDRQISMTDFDRLAQIQDITRRNKALESIGTNNFAMDVQRELTRQKTRANLPAVKKAIKESGLTALKDNERYGGKYQYIESVNVADWKDGTRLIPKKAEFYYLENDDYARVTFYCKFARSKTEQKSAEQIEKERSIRAAWKTLKEASGLAYQLRSKFVAGLSVTAKNQAQMLDGAMSFILMEVCYHGADRDACFGALGIDPGDYEKRKLENLRSAYLEKQSGDKTVLPRLIYAAFADSKKPAYSTSYQDDYPKFQKNPNADMLYDWLTSLGYEMSDEEKTLRDGTHPAFAMNEAQT